MIKIPKLIIFAAILSGVLNFEGITQAATRDQVDAYFALRHPQDTTQTPEEFWSKMPSDTPKVLLQMLNEKPGPYQKTQILGALGYFESPEVSQALKKEVDQTPNNTFKKYALGSLIRSEGGASLDFVAPYLKSEDAQIRRTVATQLKKYAQVGKYTKPVQEVLTKFEKEEKLDWVGDLHDSKWEGVFEGVLLKGDLKAQKMLTQPVLLELSWVNKKWKVSEKGLKTKRFKEISDLEIQFFSSKNLDWVEIKSTSQNAVWMASKQK